MTYPIPKPREKSHWLNLSQGSLPLALARSLPYKQLKVVLTQDAEQALRLQTAWLFFRPHDTAVFPAGLGNAALRAVFAASGFGVRTALGVVAD